MTDDAELLRRFVAEGDDAAFGEFVHRHLGLVLASAARRLGGDEHRAREVAQQVFIAAAGNARRLARHGSVVGWLFTATRNASMNLMRDEQRRLRREREAAEAAKADAVTNSGADDSERWAEIAPQLEQAMDRLKRGDREAVLLRYFSGLPLGEVGRRLGLSENAARMRVQRAVERLGATLARGGMGTTAAGLGAALSARASVCVSRDVATAVSKSALASASAGGGVVSGVFLMSATKWAGTIITACALTGMGGLWRHSRAELRALESEHAAVAARMAATRSARDAAQQRGVALEAEAGRLAQRVELARKELAAATAAPTPAWDPVKEGDAFLAQHPEVKTALDSYVAAATWFKYGSLFRERGWSNAQIAEFMELVGGRQGMGAALANGNSVTLRSSGGGIPPDFSERMQRLLGSDGLRRWDELRQELAGRYVAREVASALYFTDTPLTPEQARALVRIVTETNPPKTVAGVVPLDWTAVLEKAREKFAPAQVEAIELLRAKGEFQRLFGRPRVTDAPAPGKVSQ